MRRWIVWFVCIRWILLLGNNITVLSNYKYPVSINSLDLQYVRKLSTSFMVSTLLLSKSSRVSATIDNEFIIQDISTAAMLISSNCKTVLESVRNTGRLLYRGFNTTGSVTDGGIYFPKMKCELPNLLLPSTYSSPLAADYFKYVGNEMESRNYLVTPKNGHIATSDINVASEWGAPESVWPLDIMHYASLKYNKYWWNEDWASPQGTKGPLFWRNKDLLQQFVTNEVLYDQGLDGALARGAEVMFSRESINPRQNGETSLDSYRKSASYITIPLRLEPQLLQLLQIIPYSTNLKIKATRDMDVDNSELKYYKRYNFK